MVRNSNMQFTVADRLQQTTGRNVLHCQKTLQTQVFYLEIENP